MTTPTHIRAWVAVDLDGNMQEMYSSDEYMKRQAHIVCLMKDGWTFKPVTIVLGHDLADQLEKVK